MARLAPQFNDSADPLGLKPVLPQRDFDVVRGAPANWTLPSNLLSAVTPGNSLARTYDAWGLGYAQRGDIESTWNAAGINYSSAGANFGVGYHLDENTVVGVLGGYASTSVHGGGNVDSSSGIRTKQLGLYLRIRTEEAYLLGIAAYGRQQTDATRRIQFAAIDREAKADIDGDEFSTWWEYGRNLHVAAGILQPFVGVQYIGLWTDGYTEEGAGALNLQVGDQNNNSLRSQLGARFLLPMAITQNSPARLIPEVSARWMHEFLDDDRVLPVQFAGTPGSTFNTQGVSAGQDFAVLGTGATLQLNDSFSLYAHYIAQVNNQFTSNTGLGGFTLAW
jgi:subtilase-type serine protease